MAGLAAGLLTASGFVLSSAPAVEYVVPVSGVGTVEVRTLSAPGPNGGALVYAVMFAEPSGPIGTTGAQLLCLNNGGPPNESDLILSYAIDGSADDVDLGEIPVKCPKLP